MYVNGTVHLESKTTVPDAEWACRGVTSDDLGKFLVEVGHTWTGDPELDADSRYVEAIAAQQVINILGFVANGFGDAAALRMILDVMERRSEWRED